MAQREQQTNGWQARPFDRAITVAYKRCFVSKSSKRRGRTEQVQCAEILPGIKDYLKLKGEVLIEVLIERRFHWIWIIIDQCSPKDPLEMGEYI